MRWTSQQHHRCGPQPENSPSLPEGSVHCAVHSCRVCRRVTQPRLSVSRPSFLRKPGAGEASDGGKPPGGRTPGWLRLGLWGPDPALFTERKADSGPSKAACIRSVLQDGVRAVCFLGQNQESFSSASALTSSRASLEPSPERPLEFAHGGGSQQGERPSSPLAEDTQLMGTWAPVDDVGSPCSPPRLSSSRCLVFQSLGNRKCCSIFSTEDGMPRCRWSLELTSQNPSAAKKLGQNRKLTAVWKTKSVVAFFLTLKKKMVYLHE